MSIDIDSGPFEALAAYDLAPPVELFALPYQGASNTSVGIRTGAGELIWKNYSCLHPTESVHYEHDLLRRLSAAGLSFAVPMPLPTRDGSLLYQGAAGRVSLVPRLPGVHLDPNRLDHVELMGAALGELQSVLQWYPTIPRPGNPLFVTLFQFPERFHNPFTLMPAEFGLPDAPPYSELLGWWRQEATQLQAFVAGRYRRLPWQVCHNDITPVNMLVEGNCVRAVLDWEFAAPAARALDVAMGLQMTMRVWENAEPWEAVHRFCHGYTRWMPFTEAEARALPSLIRLRKAVVVLWWLGRSPTDNAPLLRSIEFLQNFVRWLDRYAQCFVDVVLQSVG